MYVDNTLSLKQKLNKEEKSRSMFDKSVLYEISLSLTAVHILAVVIAIKK